MAKLLFWIITLIGLVPAVLLVVETANLIKMVHRSPDFARSGNFPIIHDMYVSVGLRSMTIAVFPRIWVLTLVGFGVACVVVGLIFLLHVPATKA